MHNELQAKIELAEALERLNVNADFLKLLKSFTQNNVQECVGTMCRYTLNDVRHQQLVERLQAVSYFKDYLEQVVADGQWAKDELYVLETNPEYGDDDV